MKAYHLSQTLQTGDTLQIDHQRLAALAQPFVQGLQQSRDCFMAMVLNAKYLYAVLRRYGMREWCDYAKWATEGAFEYVRATAFPTAVSRLHCGFFYDDLENVRRLYALDWGEATQEEQAAVHLFSFTLQDTAIQRYDMGLYDEAYTAMEQTQDVERVLACAHRYFAGQHTDAPVWELLYPAPATAEEDLTALLR